MTAQHVLVPLRRVFETVVAEIAPMGGRTGAGKLNGRMGGIKHDSPPTIFRNRFDLCNHTREVKYRGTLL
jgi:hypothetical protein